MKLSYKKMQTAVRKLKKKTKHGSWNVEEQGLENLSTSPQK